MNYDPRITRSKHLRVADFLRFVQTGRLRYYRTLLLLSCALALTFGCKHDAFAAFGFTPVDGGYVIDNGADLLFTVNARGDIPSCTYKGTQVCDPRKSSGIASGLGASSVNAVLTGNCIVVTCVSASVARSPFTHYYIIQKGVNDIYMADYVTSEPNIGELRYIFRALYSVLPHGPPHSDNFGSPGPIESKDIFGHPDGTTTSKYYGNHQAKDLGVNGATGNGIGLFMAFGSRESSSGGPFYRDIENQEGGDQEIYNYMNSGHAQLEEHRANVLYGPYAYVFTDGTTPAVPDFSFVSNLGLTGYVGAAGRGQVVVAGIKGRSADYAYTVAFSNSTAQYWATASPSNGECTCAGMKPGTYAMTIYKKELGVWTGSVDVAAGNTTKVKAITITDDPSTVMAIWRIGDWDGAPLKFENGTLINIMHPSDVRMKTWKPVVYNVGVTPTGEWPAVQFREANSPSTINFTLNAKEAASAHTFKIGITDALYNGRPVVAVNGNKLDIPEASRQSKTRTLTTGSYRGNNTTYTWSIPPADFVAGNNTITITSFGNANELSTWLCPSFIYDCVELDD